MFFDGKTIQKSKIPGSFSLIYIVCTELSKNDFSKKKNPNDTLFAILVDFRGQHDLKLISLRIKNKKIIISKNIDFLTKKVTVFPRFAIFVKKMCKKRDRGGPIFVKILEVKNKKIRFQHRMTVKPEN